MYDGHEEMDAMARRIIYLEKALENLTSSKFHDALCLTFEEWMPEHRMFEEARALVTPRSPAANIEEGPDTEPAF